MSTAFELLPAPVPCVTLPPARHSGVRNLSPLYNSSNPGLVPLPKERFDSLVFATLFVPHERGVSIGAPHQFRIAKTQSAAGDHPTEIAYANGPACQGLTITGVCEVRAGEDAWLSFQVTGVAPDICRYVVTRLAVALAPPT